MNQYTVIGKSLPRVDALEKATGKAVYTTDIKLSRMLQNIENRQNKSRKATRGKRYSHS